MMDPLYTHSCQECGVIFKGRADKRFCSDQCRTSCNNKLRRAEHMYIREVNSILKKNRRILLLLNPTGKNKVSMEKLKSRGFNFNYFTSIYRTREGVQYFFCYEQGYLPLQKDQCLLVVRKD